MMGAVYQKNLKFHCRVDLHTAKLKAYVRNTIVQFIYGYNLEKKKLSNIFCTDPKL